jgi:hypothetical protein
MVPLLVFHASLSLYLGKEELHPLPIADPLFPLMIYGTEKNSEKSLLGEKIQRKFYSFSQLNIATSGGTVKSNCFLG